MGIWYAIQKTSTASSCLIYNITRGEEPGEYFIEQTSQHFALGLTPLKHEYSYTGQLSVPIPELPSKMKVKFPLSKFFKSFSFYMKKQQQQKINILIYSVHFLDPAGDSDFSIFMTDYETYAGVFTCQKLAFAHRQSATLLSRNRDLDKVYVDKVNIRFTFQILLKSKIS